MAEQSSEEDDSLFTDLNVKSGSPFRSVTMPYFDNIELSTLIESDTKFHRVLRMIQSILQDSPTEKIVIFSFFRGTVEYLYRHLSRAGIRCSSIMGGLKDNEKTERLLDFRDKNINVLVSTEVGSDVFDYVGRNTRLEIRNDQRLVISQMLAQPYEMIPEIDKMPWELKEQDVTSKGISWVDLLQRQNELYPE